MGVKRYFYVLGEGLDNCSLVNIKGLAQISVSRYYYFVVKDWIIIYY